MQCQLEAVMMKVLTAPLSAALILLSGSLSAAEDEEKVTFADDVLPILEDKCVNCHNPDESKGGLDLSSYSAALAGGSGGDVAVSEDPSGSRIYSLAAHLEEPFMPPKGSPTDEKELIVISNWIAGGLLETKSSTARKSDKPKIDFDSISATGKPEGPPAMPEHLILEPAVLTERPNSVPALAHSPWAPIVAVAGQKQVLLFHSEDFDLLGVLPYPEGFPQALSFSPNGAYLSCGGGRAGKSGNLVAWDIKTGERIIEAGKEYDIVLGADISPDLKNVILGGPGRNIKIWDTVAGEQINSIKKHSDWLLTAAYSPDGVIFATGGRNGGLYVWESATGYEFFTLKGHTKAVTDVAWRSDGNVLASCSEDGQVMIWEMNEGKQVKKWEAHKEGAQAITFAPNGNIATVGRDKTVKIWQVDGKQLRSITASDDVVLSVAFSQDSKRVFTGDWHGNIKVWNAETGAELGSIAPNPPTIEEQLAYSEKRISELTGALPKLEAGVKTVSKELVAAKTALTGLEQTNITAVKARDTHKAAFAKLDGQVKSLSTQVAQAKESVNAKNESVKQITDQLTVTNAQHKPLQDKLASFKKAVAEQDAKLKASTEALSAAKAAAAKPALDSEQKKQYDQLSASHAIAATAKTSSDAAPEAKAVELKSAIAALEQLKKKAETTPQELEKQAAKIGSITTELSRLRTTQKSNAELFAKSDAALAPFRTILAKGQETIKQAQASVVALTKTHGELNAARNKSATSLTEATKSLEATTLKIATLKSQLTKAQAEAKAAVAALAAKNQQVEATGKQLATNQEVLKKAEATLAGASGKKDAAKEKVDAVVKKEAATLKSIEVAKTELKTNEFLVKKWQAAAINLTAHQESDELEDMTVELADLKEDETDAKTDVAEATKERKAAETKLADAKKTVAVGTMELRETSTDVLERALELVASRAITELREEIADEAGTLIADVAPDLSDSSGPLSETDIEIEIEEEQVDTVVAETLAYKSREELDLEVNTLRERLSELEGFLKASYSEADKTKSTVEQAGKVARDTPKVIAEKSRSEQEAANELTEAEAERVRQEKALKDQQNKIEELRAKYLKTLPDRE